MSKYDLCPYCKETIKPEAIFCKHCQKDLSDNKVGIENASKEKVATFSTKIKILLLVLFIISLITCIFLIFRPEASAKISEDKCNQIAMGMTIDEVASKLGEPGNKLVVDSYDYPVEHWYFYSESLPEKEYKMHSSELIKWADAPESDRCIISFTNDVVSSETWESYQLGNPVPPYK